MNMILSKLNSLRTNRRLYYVHSQGFIYFPVLACLGQNNSPRLSKTFIQSTKHALFCFNILCEWTRSFQNFWFYIQKYGIHVFLYFLNYLTITREENFQTLNISFLNESVTISAALDSETILLRNVHNFLSHCFR